jgi:hypothetical protein
MNIVTFSHIFSTAAATAWQSCAASSECHIVEANRVAETDTTTTEAHRKGRKQLDPNLQESSSSSS